LRSSSSISKTKRTPSFVCELPLQMKARESQILSAAFDASRQLYNACLGEAQRRLSLMRQSRMWQEARKLPKNDPTRKKLFQEAKVRFEFNEYALHDYAAKVKSSFIGEHIGINIAQKLATRAFGAVEKILFGKAKRVRFKGKNQLDSIEGKDNKQNLFWKSSGLQMKDLFLPAILDSKDPVIGYGLSKKVKYCRLVRRRIRNQTYFFVQLVCEGEPLSLRERKSLKSEDEKIDLPKSSEPVGLDLGPSTLAIVTEDRAYLKQFCEELKDPQKELRRLQRKIDRQRRANNPQNYRKDGTIAPGRKKWKSSRRQKETEREAAELYRKTASHRKSLHGQLINQIIPLESEIRLEKLSYRSFQKNFGKSVGNRAPGMFMNRLKRKAENAGGSVVEFSPYQTRLSQVCLCERVMKKPLSQRVHECPCGIKAQRDLFSAYLARFVQDEQLNVSMAQKSWKGAEMLLQTAFEQAVQTANGRIFPSSFGKPEKSGSSEKERATCKRRKPDDKTWNDVRTPGEPGLRVQGSQTEFSFRTPRL